MPRGFVKDSLDSEQWRGGVTDLERLDVVLAMIFSYLTF